MNDQAAAMTAKGAAHVSGVVDAIMQQVRPCSGCTGSDARNAISEIVRTELAHDELEGRGIIAAQAATIAELQGLLTSTRPPALALMRDLATRDYCDLSRELDISIDDALELKIRAGRAYKQAEAAGATLANAA